MAPNIIFDKSAFQCLSNTLHATRLFMFHHNITPILLRELIADLAKQPSSKDGRSSEEIVSGLAQKFHGGGGFVNVDWKLVCLNSLDGAHVPMTGQIMADESSTTTSADGTAVLFGQTQENRSILRWASKRFHPGERVDAEVFRREAQAFSMDTVRGRLTSTMALRAASVGEIGPLVDGILRDRSRQGLLVEWMVDQLRPLNFADLPRIRLEIRHRWRKAGEQLLLDFAPYAHYCARVLLMLVVSTSVPPAGLMSRVTNRLDAEYLLYLPFCHVFVSGDNFHRLLAPMLLRTDQTFVWADDFRADLQRVHAAESGADEGRRRRLSYAFSARPWPHQGSILWQVWEKWCPWTPRYVNRAVVLSEEERQQALHEAEAMVEAARN
jgi:hypothetical protein